jgi:hypothetical protein
MNDSCKAAEAPSAATNLTQRRPADLANQLLRDAVSLELTGSHLTKDEAFYNAVSANVREAAAFLHKWQPTLDAHRDGWRLEVRDARITTAQECLETAVLIRDSVPHRTGLTVSWRAAADAIVNAITARIDAHRSSGLLLPMAGIDASAPKTFAELNAGRESVRGYRRT